MTRDEILDALAGLIYAVGITKDEMERVVEAKRSAEMQHKTAERALVSLVLSAATLYAPTMGLGRATSELRPSYLPDDMRGPIYAARCILVAYVETLDEVLALGVEPKKRKESDDGPQTQIH